MRRFFFLSLKSGKDIGKSEELVRLNRRRSGKTCSGTGALVAMTLLLMLAAAALTIGSGSAPLRIAGHGYPSRRSVPDPQPTSAPAPLTHGSPQALATYSHLPLMFEPNQGQTDARVRFLARGSGYGLYLTAQEAVLARAWLADWLGCDAEDALRIPRRRSQYLHALLVGHRMNLAAHHGL